MIAPSAGQSDLFFSTCGGGTSSISAFNSLPSGRASGNISAPTNFSSFLASPKVGSTVLSWGCRHVSSVTIAGLGNFSGDTGLTVATPATSTTFTLTAAGGVSAAASVTASQIWGAADDVSVAGDFDGDGRADLAVYRPATGQWFIARSTAGFLQVAWGAPALGDIPAPADYDGDGKTDVAVFRMATGQGIASTRATGPQQSWPGARRDWATGLSPLTTTAMARPTSRSTGRRPATGWFDCHVAAAGRCGGAHLRWVIFPSRLTTMATVVPMLPCTAPPPDSGSSHSRPEDQSP